MLYFGNPDDHVRRANFSIHSSSDGGLLWESVSDVFTGGAAYSDLSMTRQGDIAFAFERGPYDRDPYAWLSFGKISPSAQAAGLSTEL